MIMSRSSQTKHLTFYELFIMELCFYLFYMLNIHKFLVEGITNYFPKNFFIQFTCIAILWVFTNDSEEPNTDFSLKVSICQ